MSGKLLILHCPNLPSSDGYLEEQENDFVMTGIDAAEYANVEFSQEKMRLSKSVFQYQGYKTVQSVELTRILGLY